MLCCSSLALPFAAVACGFQTAESAAESQFAAAEATRASFQQVSFQVRRAFELTVSAVQEFVAASDSLALEIIRLQAIPEGVMLQAAVGRLRAAYGLMPKVEYACEGRTACFNRGAEVEAAYSALLRELRRQVRAEGCVCTERRHGAAEYTVSVLNWSWRVAVDYDHI